MFICGDHHGQSLEYWCKSDDTLVCKNCLIFGSHHGHKAVQARGPSGNKQQQVVSDFGHGVGGKTLPTGSCEHENCVAGSYCYYVSGGLSESGVDTNCNTNRRKYKSGVDGNHFSGSGGLQESDVSGNCKTIIQEYESEVGASCISRNGGHESGVDGNSIVISREMESGVDENKIYACSGKGEAGGNICQNSRSGEHGSVQNFESYLTGEGFSAGCHSEYNSENNDGNQAIKELPVNYDHGTENNKDSGLCTKLDELVVKLLDKSATNVNLTQESQEMNLLQQFLTTNRDLQSPSDVQRQVSLLSSAVNVDVKKSALDKLTRVHPSVLTEDLVIILLKNETDGLVSGLKSIIKIYHEKVSRFGKEMLILGLTFFNQCLGMQSTSLQLRNLVFNISYQLTESKEGLSLIQEIVRLADPNDGKLSLNVCHKLTGQLSNYLTNQLIGRKYRSCDSNEEISSSLKTCLAITEDITNSDVMRNLENMYGVIELKLLEGDKEILVSDLLLSSDSGLWGIKHPVGSQVRDWCSIKVMRVFPCGHILVSDPDYLDHLERLQEEMEIGLSRLPVKNSRIRPGSVVCVNWTEFKPDLNIPLVFRVARGLVTTVGLITVKVYLIDYGYHGLIPLNTTRLVPPTMATLAPRLFLCKVKGVTPAPSLTLLSPAITALSLVSNKRTGPCLVNGFLSTPRILCQLLVSNQDDIILPTLTVLHTLSITEVSLNYLTSTLVTSELFIPAFIELLCSNKTTLPTGLLNMALETLHSFLNRLSTEILTNIFSDGSLETLLTKLSVQALGYQADLVNKIFNLGPITSNTKSNIRRQKIDQTVPISCKETMKEYVGLSVNNNTMLTFNSCLDRDEEYKHDKEDPRLLNDTLKVFREKMKEIKCKSVSSSSTNTSLVKDDKFSNQVTGEENDAGRIVIKSGSVTISSTGESSSLLEPEKLKNTYYHEEVIHIPTESHVNYNIEENLISKLPSWLGGSDDESSEEEHFNPKVANIDELDEILNSTEGVSKWSVKDSQVTALLAEPQYNDLQPMGQQPLGLINKPELLVESQDNGMFTLVPTDQQQPSMVNTPVLLAESQDNGMLSMGPMGQQRPSMVNKPLWKQSVSLPSSDIKWEVICDIEKLAVQKGTLDVPKLTMASRSALTTAENIKNEETQEILIRNYILSEDQGIDVELCDVEKFRDLSPSKLASLIVGFLNTKVGGSIFLGVTRISLVRGVNLDRGQRDRMRQMLDKVLANQINPRVAPRIVDIDFLPVQDVDSRRKVSNLELWVVRVTVMGMAGKDKLYSAYNLTEMDLIEGVYYRKGSGPEFNCHVH